MSSANPVHRFQRRALVMMVGLLLIVAAARISQLSVTAREFHADEVWSIWALLGPQTDYTREPSWPPLYAALLDQWRQVTGIYPIPLRYLGTLACLLGTACLYRAIRRIRGESAALLGTLGFSGLALGIYLTGQVRNYALVYSMFPLALWWTLRYFEHPGLRRGIALGLWLAVMFYTAYGSVGAFLMLGLYTVIVYRQAIWRWWLPGVVGGVVAIPPVVSIATLAVRRLQPLSTTALPPFTSGFINIYRADLGYSFVVWLILFVVACLALLYRERLFRAPSLAMLAWTFSPVLLYVLNRWLGLFAPMYAWFVPLGLAAFVGIGLAYLPRLGRLVAVVVLIGILFTPISTDSITAQSIPLGRSLEWLAKNARWGDVITIDPLWKDRFCNCIRADYFEYFINLYFPQGLRVVDNPDGYRRVWYLKWASLEDQAFERRVETNRVAGIFVGPPEALFRLYEAPPDVTGVAFANGMRFHGVDILDQSSNLLARRAADKIHLRLWWSVDKPVSLDYSVALHVYFNNQLAIQSDGAPHTVDNVDPKETSQWQSGHYYIEERDLDVPRFLTEGNYPMYLAVYDSQNNERFSAPGVNKDNLLPIYTLYIKAW